MMTDQPKIPDDVREAANRAAIELENRIVRPLSPMSATLIPEPRTVIDIISEAFRDFVRTPLPEGEWYFEVPGYVVGTFEGPFPSYDVAVKAAKMCLQRGKGNGVTHIHFIAKEEVTAGEQDMSDELKINREYLARD